MRSNWLWLADLPGRERALAIQGGVGTLMAPWARHFGFVHHLASPRSLQVQSADPDTANIATAGASPCALPYRDAAFDCVIWEGVLERGVTAARGADASAVLAQVFGECRRVLRPGGCLYLGVAVAAWPGRPVGAARILSALARIVLRCAAVIPHVVWQRRVSAWVPHTDRLSLPPAMGRLLKEAGFSSVQAFYIDPSFHQPWSITPARRRAVLAYESRQAASAGLRWWIAWLGLHPLLYESHMFLAYARESEASPAPRRV